MLRHANLISGHFLRLSLWFVQYFTKTELPTIVEVAGRPMLSHLRASLIEEEATTRTKTDLACQRIKMLEIKCSTVILFALTEHKNSSNVSGEQKVSSVVHRRCCCNAVLSEAGRASYASWRKLDKRISLIALARRFPTSRSAWWSARSPPCYSLCASQVSTCMSVFISQVALAWLRFLPLCLLAAPRCEWDWADLSLMCISEL